VYEDSILPVLCRKLVETVDGALLRDLEARPPVAQTMSDLEMLRQQLADLEKQIETASARYLRAPAPLMPALEESLKQMHAQRDEAAEKYQRLAAAASEAPVTNFTRWWLSVREKLLVVPVTPQGAGHEAARVWFQLGCGHSDAPERLIPWDGPDHETPAPNEHFAYVEPAALRSLLHRLGVQVTCFWRRAGTLAKPTPGRGRGPSWVLDRAVLKVSGRPEETVPSGCHACT
jgi:hypothetical protein